MRVAIHQPQYWPWPLYLHKIISADVFVYLDTVQYSKNGYQNRNQVKTAQGACWLTLPVVNSLGTTIRDMKIASPKALRNHGKTIQANYARTAGYIRWRADLEAFFAQETDSLCEVAIGSCEWLLTRLQVQAKRIRASSLGVHSEHGSKLVASICRTLGARTYLSGTGALEYMHLEDFKEIGCEVHVQKWLGLIYAQPPGSGDYIPHLSALDLLLNCPDDARGLLEQAGSWEPCSERVSG